MGCARANKPDDQCQAEFSECNEKSTEPSYDGPTNRLEANSHAI